MRNFATTLVFGIMYGQLAFAVCQLDAPITISGKKVLQTDQSKMITLEHVVFDKTYKTKVIPPPSSISNMQLKIFEVTWSIDPSGPQKATGWAGTSFGPLDTINNAGFSFGYGGNFIFEGSTETSGEYSTYSTSEKSPTFPGITATKITTQGDSLIGIEITIPVRDRIQLPSGAYYTPYLGEDETLCVKSAKLRG